MAAIKRVAAGFLAALMLCGVLVSCNSEQTSSNLPDDGTESVIDDSTMHQDTTEPPVSDTEDPTEDTSEGTDTDTTETEPVDTEPVDTEPVETEPVDTEPVDTEPVDTEPVETDPPETEPVRIPTQLPENVNPLTGLEMNRNLSGRRPAAIMINNIKISCPQNGVASADVMYECLVEGGYTRLMMLTLDYASLPEVGSVRSARDYYLDFAADFDALFVHAGGSPYAYEAIAERGVNNMDGVNMWIPDMFYRNSERVTLMGLEHSLMTTGPNIVSGVKFKKYRTALQENFDYPLDFAYGEEPITFADTSTEVCIKYSSAQTVHFVYSPSQKTYYRFQFNGVPHVDGLTGEQLKFENLLIVFCKTGAITGDAKNRIEVGTVGKGTGYYVTNGTYTSITWEKTSHESPIRYFDAEGNPLEMNPGKTFVSVCPTTVEQTIRFNPVK